MPHHQRRKGCNIYFDKERVLEWWEKYHHPTPVNLKLERIRLIKRK
jgi:hypothetical protein